MESVQQGEDGHERDGAEGTDAAATDGSEESIPRREISSVRNWFFLAGNRLVVAGCLLGVVLVALTVVDPLLGSIDRAQMSPVFLLFSALTGGTFTLVTIIVSVGQLVISRQLGSPGELRDQIEATNEYRETIEESVEREVAPVTPTEFLHLLLESGLSSLERLRGYAEELDDADAREDLLEIVDDIAAHVETVEHHMERPDLNLVSALAATLTTNYSEDIYEFRQLRATYDETFTTEISGCLDDMVVRLQQIDVARQYLKTLYMQDELSRLSVHLLYVGVPAVLTSVFMLRTFASGNLVFSPAELFVVIPVAVTLSLSPVAVLFAYVVRLATVSRRTVAITPFTLQSQEVEIQSEREEESVEA